MDGYTEENLLARFFILENLVVTLVSRQPDAEEIVDAFEAYSAQQIAMQAANGSPASFVAALRTELANLASFAKRKGPG